MVELLPPDCVQGLVGVDEEVMVGTGISECGNIAEVISKPGEKLIDDVPGCWPKMGQELWLKDMCGLARWNECLCKLSCGRAVADVMRLVLLRLEPEGRGANEAPKETKSVSDWTGLETSIPNGCDDECCVVLSQLSVCMCGSNISGAVNPA